MGEMCDDIAGIRMRMMHSQLGMESRSGTVTLRVRGAGYASAGLVDVARRRKSRKLSGLRPAMAAKSLETSL
jgi:hypothetical protein